MSKLKFIRNGVLFAIMAVAGIFLLSAVVMQLWNHILVPVLTINPITLWQALGIFVLSKILFGGFKGRGCRCRKCKRKGKGKMMMEKWHKMSPEERENFRNKLRSRCSSWKRDRDIPQSNDASAPNESNSVNPQ